MTDRTEKSGCASDIEALAECHGEQTKQMAQFRTNRPPIVSNIKLPADCQGGVINVYKPVDWTSFDVVAVLRRLFGLRRIGHCGTLDPFATGVLPVFIGRSTTMVRFTEDYDKAYRVTFRLGAVTDTQDLTGTFIGGTAPSPEQIAQWRHDDWRFIRKQIRGLIGRQTQTPPMYSAVKVNGKPLYYYARKGMNISRPSRQIEVYDAAFVSAQVVDHRAPLEVVMDVHCSKGTYIRTLCTSLGEALGCGAYAVGLERRSCGPFKAKDSWTIDALKSWCLNQLFDQDIAALAKGTLEHAPIEPVCHAAMHYPVVKLERSDARRLVQGQRVNAPLDAIQKTHQWLETAIDDQAGPFFMVQSDFGFLGMAGIRIEENPPQLVAERIMTQLDNHQT